jgi:outer membrane protein assembly factor BamB
VSKFLGIILLLIFIASCSLDDKTGLWTKNQRLKEEKKIIIKELFEKEKALEKEFNPNLKINLSAKLIDNSFINNFDNNNGRVNYNGTLKIISKFKFSKIDNFNQLEPEIIFDKNNVIFFDDKGSILKFDNFSKLIWKKNYYTKIEKKSKPILFFANNKNTLVVADSIAKYYAININNGELLWSKNNSAPFNSQVKIYKDKFFAIDFENILRCYSIKNGTELWQVKTDQSLIKSQKKLSLVILDNNVYFNNSIGDVSAVDMDSGNLLWQTPTQSSGIYEEAFFLKTSDLIANNNSILFSNNKNEFFSLDIKRGNLNWKQKVNSNIRSTLVDNIIFAVSMEGFLIIIDNQSGNIIRITDVFTQYKRSYFKKRSRTYTFGKKKKSKSSKRVTKEKTKPTYTFGQNRGSAIEPVGFIVGSKNIYLTTSHGRLIVIDITTGKPTSVLKIDNDKISRPFVLNKNLFIIKDNAIIKLD